MTQPLRKTLEDMAFELRGIKHVLSSMWHSRYKNDDTDQVSPEFLRTNTFQLKSVPAAWALQIKRFVIGFLLVERNPIRDGSKAYTTL
jgi:hypothetical protein